MRVLVCLFLALLAAVALAQPELAPLVVQDEQDVNRLIERLAPPRPDGVRLEAAKRLALLNVPATTQALVTALEDDTPAVREQVVRALGLIGDRTVVQMLAAVAVNDDTATVRAAAVTALGWLQDARAVDALTAALRDTDAAVRQAAAVALGRIDDPGVEAPLRAAAGRDELAVSIPALVSLARRGDRTITPRCLELLGKGEAKDPRLLRAVADLRDPAAVEALLPLINHPDENTRRLAGIALARIDDPAASTRLCDALQARAEGITDPNVRNREGYSVFLPILRQANPQYVDALLFRWLSDQKLGLYSVPANVLYARYDVPVDRLMAISRNYGWLSHWGAMEVLANRQPAQVVPDLIAMVRAGKTKAGSTDLCARITQPRPWRDSRQLDGLLGPPPPPIAFTARQPKPGAWISDPVLTEHIISRILRDEDCGFYMGLTGDRRLTATFCGLLTKEYVRTKGAAGHYLHDLADPTAIPHLLKAAEDERNQAWYGAVAGLAGCADGRHQESYQLLVQHLEAASPNVRKAAAAGLGSSREAQAVPQIIARMQADTVPEVREYCALALGLIGDRRAVAPLCQALNDPVEWARSAAAWALGEIGDAEALPALKAALRADPNSRFRVRVAQALYRLGDHDAAATLAELMGNTDWMTRELAYRALLETNEPRIAGSLIARLVAKSDAQVIDALGRQQSEQALLPLQLVLREDENSSCRAAAARALGDIGETAAADGLFRASTDDPASEVRAAAALGLAALRDPRAVDRLEVLLREYQPERNAALRALWALPGEKATALLAASLTDDDPLGRVLAAQGLVLRGDGRGKAALPALVDQITEPVAKQVAIRYAGELGDPALTLALITLATAEPRDVSIYLTLEAIGALGHIDTPKARQTLVELLQSPSSRVRTAAATALTGTTDTRAQAALRECLAQEEATSVGAAITRALGQKE